MNDSIAKVSLRQQAMYVPAAAQVTTTAAPSADTALLIANLAKLGYATAEPLRQALVGTTSAFQDQLLAVLREVTGTDKNWTPLVKGWDQLTGEGPLDHLVTWLANVFQHKGTRLPCGHLIPPDTFPLERYNGCPFCGTPFELASLEYTGQGSKLKELTLWTDAEVTAYLRDLLASKTALDATQQDSLQRLLAVLPLPADVVIAMKETRMAVIDAYVTLGQPQQAQAFFTSPTDILRYLWFRKTGFLQLVEPKTILRKQQRNAAHLAAPLDRSAQARVQATADLKLKYSRREAAMVADWLNALPQSPAQLCEIMHPKRGMWVRFIRALRLAEYSQKGGRDKLRETLDVFYHQTYPVWQGRVNHFRLRVDAPQTFALLQQRPGLFARSLFANMLWFGAEPTIAAFAAMIDKVPARLVFTLNMYADTYFIKGGKRAVKPLGGASKQIPTNHLLDMYDEPELEAMQTAVASLCLLAMERRFAAQPTPHRTIYIDPALYKIPVAIGDRSETVQDLPGALMGTRFPVEGDSVRLFMQWGTGLPAQHLDMDLSCTVSYAGGTESCSFSQLVATGCKHSGDIQSIPDQVGTAEYIELNLPVLQQAQAQYVTFTSNAYTHGALSPNLVVGWMSSQHPMRISSSGVAYDPSCVQQQVRVTKTLTKGLVFGVLDVAQREIVWLEMSFQGQLVQNLNVGGVQTLLRKLESKLSIGQLLAVKARAQNLQVVETTEADEVYSTTWARNTAAVTQLLVD
ncbi:prokaryotic RING finger family 4 [Hymenobacter sp. APR13]|uniref:prokaryotic RING finger family 4 n=1 Tax=Hymenobacter sp. APR13 TaxID=1356852 RepID=UPI0004E05234|nr:prokaryotic RING finger family 4 [Hymenobacter sp. APR13]AII54297.1 hypothetical protein N008_20210 [Hymenobacter sp. APR13]